MFGATFYDFSNFEQLVVSGVTFEQLLVFGVTLY